MSREHRVLRADEPPTPTVLVVAAALAVLGLVVFVLLAEDLLDGGGLISHDQAILSWFVGLRTAALVFGAEVVSALGSFVALAMLSGCLAVFVRARGWHLALAVAPLTGLLVAGLASTGAKAVFGRDRPPRLLHSTSVTLASFPSGHATDAAACFLAGSLVLALTVSDCRRSQALCVGAGFAGAGLVGLSRPVLGVHWLSDVVAGWALGMAIAIAVVVASWYWATRRMRRPVPRPSPDHVGLRAILVGFFGGLSSRDGFRENGEVADRDEERARERDGERYDQDPEALGRLSPRQYAVTQESATEPAFANEFWDKKDAGIYVDIVSGEPLFASLQKFDSGCGWPSFTIPLEPANVVERSDTSHGMVRTEVRSAHGDSHLGHVFEDGPPEQGGLRYCINSAALRFVPYEELEAEGYGRYRRLFDGAALDAEVDG